jgi:hypothetical protein
MWSYESVNVTNVTYGGTNMAKLAHAHQPNSWHGEQRAYLWGLALGNKAVSTNGVVVFYDGEDSSSGDRQVTLAARTYHGVHQAASTGTAVTNYGTSAVAQANVSSSAGELVIDCASWSSSDLVPSTNQTLRWKISDFGVPEDYDQDGAGSERAGAATVEMSWSFDSGSHQWVLAAISLKPGCVALTNQPPSVTLTNPVNNQLFVLSPTNILLQANAIDNDGTITNVAFYSGSNLLTNDTAAPYEVLWQNVPWASNYTVKAIASDNLGATTTNSVSIVVNAMPTVSVTAPTNLQSFLEVTNVTVSATATDNDGAITNVAFYSGTNYLGNDASSPFSLIWNSRTNNFYPVVAVATDNRGAVSASTIKVFQVLPTNSPPNVWITYPTNNEVFRVGADITITASATNGSGQVTNVEFFVNGLRLGSDAEPPYSITECCWKAGKYRLEARATDTVGEQSVSTPVDITVSELDPTPGNGSWDATFVLDQFYRDLTVYAVAMDTEGNMYASGFNDDEGIEKPFLKWNGSGWSHLGGTLGGVARAIVPLGTDVYAAGEYASETDSCVSKWNGTSWTAVGDPLNGIVRAIAVIGSELYVGGDFTQAGTNTSVQYVAKLSGTNWIPVGNGLIVTNGVGVRAIIGLGNELHVGGEFTEAGGSANVQYLAKLSGTNWDKVGDGVNGVVRAFAVCNQALYVGGDFNVAGGLTNANGIAKWEQNTWTLLGDGLSGGTTNAQIPVAPAVYTIAARGNTVFVGGHFASVHNGPNATVANHVAQATWIEAHQTWTWTPMEEGVALDNGNDDAVVMASALHESSVTNGFELFVGGKFWNAGLKRALSLARWTVGLTNAQPNPVSVMITSPTNSESFDAPSSIDVTVVATAGTVLTTSS